MIKAPITAVVLTKNEQKTIKACLNSLNFCKEIIVLDDYSIDKTVAIAKKLRVKVLSRSLNNNFAVQRNFGLSKAKNNWVLFIDADEIVTKVLQKEIIQAVKSREFSAFYIFRQDIWLNEDLFPIPILRLAKKNTGTWHRVVHEVWTIKGKVGYLQNPLLHYPHQTIQEFLSHINFYSTLHAQALKKEGKSSNLFKIIFFPPLKFINNFVFKKGYLDGIHGFILAIIMSMHSFLGWSKLWLNSN